MCKFNMLVLVLIGCKISFIFSRHDSDTDMQALLQDHRSKYLSKDLDEVIRVTVRRSHTREDSEQAIKRSFDENKHVRVTFLGESAIDGGGPRKECFMLLLNNINENHSLLNGLSTGRVLRHNTKALQE